MHDGDKHDGNLRSGGDFQKSLPSIVFNLKVNVDIAFGTSGSSI